MRWWAVGVCVLVAGLGAAAGLRGEEAAAQPMPVQSDLPTEAGIHAIEVVVGDAMVHGLYAVPESPAGQPPSLLVFAKPFGTGADDHRHVVESFVGQGHLVLAMDYGAEPSEWAVRSGADAVHAGTRLVTSQRPVGTVVLLGISMGGEVSGLVAAEAGPGTFDHWVVGAGVMDLAMEWSEAPYFQAAIERETGGPPQLTPNAFEARSPLHQVAAIARADLRSIHLVHAPGDTVVPFEHATRMHKALEEAGAPARLHRLAASSQTIICLPVACLEEPVPVGVYNHEAGWSPYVYGLASALLRGDDAPSDGLVMVGTQT